MNVIEIEPFQLVVALSFIVVAGLSSLYYSLNLERVLLVGALRTFVQLLILGFLLDVIFSVQRSWLVLGIFGVMIFFAAWTIRNRVGEKQVSYMSSVFISMLLTYSLVTMMVTAVIIGARPWWTPQYFIPIGGMIIGNSMNAISISLERLFSELRKGRKEIEMILSLGATYQEASATIFRDAMKAGMIPSINSMMAAGIVFIPGMMTGQILAGADPMLAVKYQIVVMLMLVGSTSIGSLMVLWFIRRRCFGEAHQLII